MRYLLLVVMIGASIAGCAKDDADATIKDGSGVALNPSGKPVTPQDQAMANSMRQQGDAMNAQRDADAKAMAAAKAAAGGK